MLQCDDLSVKIPYNNTPVYVENSVSFRQLHHNAIQQISLVSASSFCYETGPCSEQIWPYECATQREHTRTLSTQSTHTFDISANLLLIFSSTWLFIGLRGLDWRLLISRKAVSMWHIISIALLNSSANKLAYHVLAVDHFSLIEVTIHREIAAYITGRSAS